MNWTDQRKNLRDFPRTYETKPYAVCLESGTISFEALFSLTQEFFIDPFDPTEQELAMFEVLYGTDSKEEYLKWMNAVIKHNKEKEDEKQS